MKLHQNLLLECPLHIRDSHTRVSKYVETVQPLRLLSHHQYQVHEKILRKQFKHKVPAFPSIQKSKALSLLYRGLHSCHNHTYWRCRWPFRLFLLCKVWYMTVFFPFRALALITSLSKKAHQMDQEYFHCHHWRQL